ncbi:hypothetical protein [Dyella acidiphila]|uniref:DUF4394 domain-containing protein n=1 Tax=Dyella acidiphila TaxID=2775866 RepID=A0ABR9G621_9GAMM|nr:hypothetical protein [Dyella acidiphila]MBE1159475.1 hypothetical protein [Dyella acidiphila]
MKRKISTVLLMLGLAGSAYATSPTLGHLFITDSLGGTAHRGAVLDVNPVTGERRTITDFGNSSQGPVSEGYQTIAWLDADVLDSKTPLLATMSSTLDVMDPSTGIRTRLSDFNDPAQGPVGGDFGGKELLVLPAKAGAPLQARILVLDPSAGTEESGAIFSVDAAGQRKIIVDFGDGTSPVPFSLFHMTYLSDNTVLVTDSGSGSAEVGLRPAVLYKVDLNTGARTALSTFDNPAQGWVPYPATSDQYWRYLSDVLVSPSGKIFATVSLVRPTPGGFLVEIDPATGRRTVISDFGDQQQGRPGFGTNAMSWMPNGLIAVADLTGGQFNNALAFAVDPVTGNRRVITSGIDSSQGPLVEGIDDMTIAP